MSRFLYRNLELLEPYEGKLSCTVLRGESSRKGADLPDQNEAYLILDIATSTFLNLHTYIHHKITTVFYKYSNQACLLSCNPLINLLISSGPYPNISICCTNI